MKDTEGFWTVNERYPARQFCRALAHLMKMHENHYTKRAGVMEIRARAGVIMSEFWLLMS
ncbi:TPA: hypothetical protein MI649_17405 [Klebsiella pneumoniae]|nr:hypothetical protein [Klebsiella pneumoniae]HBW4537305.1 hypothetical protein [Klebsiella pneumoniae]HBY7443411.1 hypothetical protein [Klebsiella pneumoniae]HBY7449288.1 hypothetical protein [Klebsiella pneumoniae]